MPIVNLSHQRAFLQNQLPSGHRGHHRIPSSSANKEYTRFENDQKISAEPSLSPSPALHSIASTPDTGGNHTFDQSTGGTNDSTNGSKSTWKQKLKIASACMMSFGDWINDSMPGALIPYIGNHTTSATLFIVSLVFVPNSVGFLLAAPITHALEITLGCAKSYAVAMASHIVGYAIIVSQPPFPVSVVTFLLYGFGLALNLALSNIFCATLRNPTVSLGTLQLWYGLYRTLLETLFWWLYWVSWLALHITALYQYSQNCYLRACTCQALASLQLLVVAVERLSR